MHLDDNPLNNKVDNLIWGTQKMNITDAINKGRLKLKGKYNPMYGKHISTKGIPRNSLSIEDRY